MKPSFVVPAALAFRTLAIAALTALTALPAHADVHGVELRNGDTVAYTFDYESDSGWADVYDCRITVRDSLGAVRFQQSFDLHHERVYCGDAGRDATRKYLYAETTHGGRTNRACLRLLPEGARQAVGLRPCGH